jgi:hypothetical protein
MVPSMSANCVFQRIDTIMTLKTIVEFGVPLVALLTSSTVMWRADSTPSQSW